MKCDNENYNDVYYREMTLSSSTKCKIITEIFETLEKFQLSYNQVEDILDCIKAGIGNRIFK